MTCQIGRSFGAFERRLEAVETVSAGVRFENDFGNIFGQQTLEMVTVLLIE